MPDRMHPLTLAVAAAPNCPAVELVALPAATRFIVRGDAAELSGLGLRAPATCRATVQGDCSLLWLGPDEFLLLAGNASDIARLRLPTNAVDISHRQTALRVAGPRAAWAINAFCALDLHPSAFPTGMCTRTLFGKAEIVLWRTDTDSFHIEVARSFAPYVWACLEEARREFLA